MINPIHWPEPQHDELPSPFLRGEKERPLRITFHTSTLIDLSAKEAESLETLYELSRLPEIEALQTEEGDFSHIEIGAFDINAKYIPITIRRDNGTIHMGIDFPRQWLTIAEELAGRFVSGSTDTEMMLNDILVARAHHECHQDILVTNSPRLLTNRERLFLCEANPCPPSEAIRIAGLYFRLHGNYTLFLRRGTRITTHRKTFYWDLARESLPNMAHYIRICALSGDVRNDDTLDLAHSVQIRCVRALEARDGIGEQFYVPATHDSGDKMLYHFDYLTLLLSGALDAQARIAYRVYEANDPKSERQVNFRREDFKKSLQAQGAHNLHQLISESYFENLITLLYELRNTIHAAGLPVPQSQGAEHPETSFLTIPNSQNNLANLIWGAAEKCGSPNEWGLTRKQYTLHRQEKEPDYRDDVLLEPYADASTLTRRIIDVINAIATATDVERLLPRGYLIPKLHGSALDRIDEISRKRVVLLG